MKKALLLFIAVFNLAVGQGQISFEKTFWGPDWESAGPVLQTSDTGYIMNVGISHESLFGAWSYLLKTDSLGNEIWQKGPNNLIYADTHNFKKNPDNSFIIVGGGSANMNSGTLYDVFLIKTDSAGQQLWIKTFDSLQTNISPFGSHEEGFDVIQTRDGGYLLTGTAGHGVAPELILLKTDSIGNFLWIKKDTGIAKAYGNSIVQAEDGNYLIFGTTSILGSDRLMYLLKTDSMGNKIWSKTYSWDYGDFTFGNVVKVNKSGKYLLYGSGWYFGQQVGEILFISTDTSGSVNWKKNYKKHDYALGSDFDFTLDGGYILGGTSQANNDMDIYLVKTDSQGNLIWDTTFGDNNLWELGSSVKQTFDKGYLISGTKDGDVYLIKTDSLANVILEINEVSGKRKAEINIYPNPLTSSSTIQLNTQLKDAEVVIYDMLGKEMMRKKLTGDKMEMERGSLESGVYFVRVRNEDREYVQKIIVE